MIKYLLHLVCLSLLTTTAMAQKPGIIEPTPTETPTGTPTAPTPKPPPATDNTCKKLAEDLRIATNSLNEAWANTQRTQEKLNGVEQKLAATEKKLADAEKKVSDGEKSSYKYKETVSKIGQIQPIIIKDIQIGLFDDDEKRIGKYGKELTTSKAKFLGVKMYYISLLDAAEDMSFTFTLTYPDKKIPLFSGKPYKYQETAKIGVGEGDVLFKPRQGQHGSNYYPSGAYSIEIQYEDTFIGKVLFTINNDNEKN